MESVSCTRIFVAELGHVDAAETLTYVRIESAEEWYENGVM